MSVCLDYSDKFVKVWKFVKSHEKCKKKCMVLSVSELYHVFMHSFVCFLCGKYEKCKFVRFDVYRLWASGYVKCEYVCKLSK